MKISSLYELHPVGGRGQVIRGQVMSMVERSARPYVRPIRRAETGPR